MFEGDTLAVPLRRNGHTAGVLLLGAACHCFAPPTAVTAAPGTAVEDQQHPKARLLGAGAASELVRLAQFVGLTLFGDASQALYLEQVSTLLCQLLDPDCPGLHDLVAAVLEALPPLLYDKFALVLHPLLAVVPQPADSNAGAASLGSGAGGKAASTGHVPAGSAVLFSRRLPMPPGGCGATLSTSGHPWIGSPKGTLNGMRPAPAGAPAAGSDGQVGKAPCSPAVAAAAAAAALEPGRRDPSQAQHYVRTTTPSSQLPRAPSAKSLALDNHASIALDTSTNDGLSGRVKAVRTALTHTLLRRALRMQPASSSAGLPPRGRPVPRGSFEAARGTMAGAVVSTLVLVDASSLATEEAEPSGRDVLLAASLTGAAVASLVLCAERADRQWQQEQHGQLARRDAAAAGAAATPSSADAAALVQGPGSLEPLLPSMFQPRAPQPAPQLRLALYVVSAESVPAGVLEAVAMELAGLMPVIYAALRTALASHRPLAIELGHLTGQQQPNSTTITYDTLCSSTLASGAPPGSPAQQQQGAPGDPAPPDHYDYLRSSNSLSATAAFGPQAAAVMPVGHQPASPAPTPAQLGSLVSPQAAPLPQHHGQRRAAHHYYSPLVGPGTAAAASVAPHGIRRRPPSASPSLHSLQGPRRALSMAAAALRAGSLWVFGEDEDGGEGAAARPTSLAGARQLAAALGRNNDPSGGRGPHPVNTAATLGLPPCPVLTVEEAAGPRPLELLVSSARSRITAVADGVEGGVEARLAASQDLSAVELFDIIGRGGQGVIFRGALHGLECAVKVVEHVGRAPLEHEGMGPPPAAVYGTTEEASDAVGDGGGTSDIIGQQAARARARARADAGAEAQAQAEAETGTAAGAEEMHSNAGALEHMRQAKREALEVAVMTTLSHPNVVQVFAQFSEVVVVERRPAIGPPQTRLCAPDDPALEGVGALGALNSVLCLEYCDCGSLADAVRRGDFRLPGSGPEEGAVWPSLVPLYTSLLEVALSLRYLHSRRLVHCDLKPQNVLLKSTARDPRGWSCKLSDFGCVRLMDETAADGQLGFTATVLHGTVPYMSPEIFEQGRLQGPAVDSYSFGIMMWELMHGTSAFSGVNKKELPALVVRQQLRPVFHPLSPPDYSALACRCWSAKPERRPTASELVAQLQGLLSVAKSAAASTQRSGPAPGTRAW